MTAAGGAAPASSPAADALPRQAAPREDLRRAVHAASGVLGPLALWAPGRAGGWLLGALALVALLLEAGRRARPAVRHAVDAAAGALFRPGEAAGVSGPTTLALGYAAAWGLFPARAAATAIVVAALADPAAALVGRRFARGGGKSLAGSLACALAAGAVILAAGAGAAAAAAGAAATALAERAPWRGADNLLVPLAAGATLTLLSPS